METVVLFPAFDHSFMASKRKRQREERCAPKAALEMEPVSVSVSVTASAPARRRADPPFTGVVNFVYHAATGRYGHCIERSETEARVWFPASSAADNVECVPATSVGAPCETPPIPQAAFAHPASSSFAADFLQWENSSCTPSCFLCDATTLYACVQTCDEDDDDALDAAKPFRGVRDIAEVLATGRALADVLDKRLAPARVDAAAEATATATAATAAANAKHIYARIHCTSPSYLATACCRLVATPGVVWVSRAWCSDTTTKTSLLTLAPPTTRVCTVTLRATKDAASAAACTAACDMLPGLAFHRFHGTGEVWNAADADAYADADTDADVFRGAMYDAEYHVQRTFLTWPMFAALVACKSRRPAAQFPEPLASYVRAVRAAAAARKQAQSDAHASSQLAFNCAPECTRAQCWHAITLYYWAVLHVDDATLPAPREALRRALEMYLAFGTVVLRKRAYAFKHKKAVGVEAEPEAAPEHEHESETEPAAAAAAAPKPELELELVSVSPEALAKAPPTRRQRRKLNVM
jgi:hypothetical protein